MSSIPTEEGVGRTVRFLHTSLALARQVSHVDEVIRIAPILLRALPAVMMQAEINGVGMLSSVDSAKPRLISGQSSLLQSDLYGGNSDVTSIEGWLDEIVQASSVTRRALLMRADDFFVDGWSRFEPKAQEYLVRSVRRFADEALHSRPLLEYAYGEEKPDWLLQLIAEIPAGH